jgi:hypothetical protein
MEYMQFRELTLLGLIKNKTNQNEKPQMYILRKKLPYFNSLLGANLLTSQSALGLKFFPLFFISVY